jgi:hypothetical protein
MISWFSQKRWSVGGLILFWLLGFMMGMFMFSMQYMNWRTVIAGIMFLGVAVITFIYANASEKEWMEQYRVFVNENAKWKSDKKKSGDDVK